MGLRDMVALLGHGSATDRGKFIALSFLVHCALEQMLIHGPWRTWGLQKIRAMNPKKSNEAEGLWTGMCSRAVFSFHHLLMLPLCISHVAMKEFWDDPFLHSTPATRGILTIAAGHFLYDTLAAVRDVKADGVAFVVHGALASALFCGSSLGGQAWNFWAIAYFLWELSTPFVHALYFLVALGMKGTNWYTINGFCLTAVFTLCRIVWTAYLDFFFFRCAFLALRGEMDPGPPGKGFVVFAMFACTFLTGLNVFWWSKMVAYVVKALVPRKEGKGKRE